MNAERRRAVRRVPRSDEPLSRMRLRTGRELLVLDVSGNGALVEGSVRLLPGTHVDVHMITTAGRVLVRSRVARCYVHALEAHSVSYRGALTFDRHVDTTCAGYAVPPGTGADIAAVGPLYPDDLETASAA